MEFEYIPVSLKLIMTTENPESHYFHSKEFFFFGSSKYLKMVMVRVNYINEYFPHNLYEV